MENLRDRVIEVLQTIFDPELPVNIYELGLIYDVKISENNVVDIVMTLTAPACPVAGEIVFDVQQKVSAIEGVTDAHVQLTFEPSWTKDMMSEEARLELGFM